MPVDDQSRLVTAGSGSEINIIEGKVCAGGSRQRKR